VDKNFSRTDRVAQQVQQEIAMILQRDFKDPRIGWVTVSEVEVTKDLAYVSVFVTFFGKEEEEIAEALEILNKANGFLRMEIGKRMRLPISIRKKPLAIQKDKVRRAESGKNPAEDLDD